VLIFAITSIHVRYAMSRSANLGLCSDAMRGLNASVTRAAGAPIPRPVRMAASAECGDMASSAFERKEPVEWPTRTTALGFPIVEVYAPDLRRLVRWPRMLTWIWAVLTKPEILGGTMLISRYGTAG
jgi:hypothetical protein